jgi:hypothetical protein
MRSGILVAGIVLLLMGIIGVVVVSGDVSTCNSGTGQLAQDFSSAAASDCGTYAAIEGVAFLFGIIGLILTILGAALKPSTPEVHSIVLNPMPTSPPPMIAQPASPQVACRTCGRIQAEGPSFCPNCGTAMWKPASMVPPTIPSPIQ